MTLKGTRTPYTPTEDELKFLRGNRSSKQLGKMNMNELLNEIEFIKPEDAPLHSTIRGSEAT